MGNVPVLMVLDLLREKRLLTYDDSLVTTGHVILVVVLLVLFAIAVVSNDLRFRGKHYGGNLGIRVGRVVSEENHSDYHGDYKLSTVHWEQAYELEPSGRCYPRPPQDGKYSWYNCPHPVGTYVRLVGARGLNLGEVPSDFPLPGSRVPIGGRAAEAAPERTMPSPVPANLASDRPTFFENAQLEFEKGPLSLLCIDVDDFSRYNEQVGRQKADEMLVQVARRCRENLGTRVNFGHTGGDEFCATLPVSRAEALTAAQNLVRRVGGLGVTVSVGVSSAPAEADSVAALLTLAEQALERAKASGKNTAV